MKYELENRIKLVLARLALLSEAPASRPSELSPPEHGGTDEKGRKHPRPKPEEWRKHSSQTTRSADSSIPAGVRDDIRSVSLKERPDKERSLCDWYAWEFAQVIDEPHLLENLCEVAELEWEERCFRSPERVGVRSGTLTDNDVRDGGAAERADAKRVVEWYEGRSAAWVAARENTTEAWIHKARRQHNRQPQDGKPRSEFLDLSEDERFRKAAEMKARGMGYRVAADKMRIGHAVMRRYWPAETARELAAA